MELLKYAAYLLIFTALFSIANAGTVIISGTCQDYVTNNAILFTLSNSGNDSAYNLILSPFLTAAMPENSSYSINALNPGHSISINVNLENISMQGTYADMFVLAYQQGSNSFSAIFPCLISYPKPTVSEVFSNVEVNITNGIGIINVSLFNAGRENITGNLSLMLPPTLSSISRSNYLFNISPYSTKNMSFSVKMPHGTSSYTAAVAASYTIKGIHYSTMSTFKLSNTPASAAISAYYLIIAGAVVIILFLLFLLFNSIRKKRMQAHITKSKESSIKEKKEFS